MFVDEGPQCRVYFSELGTTTHALDGFVIQVLLSNLPSPPPHKWRRGVEYVKLSI